MTASPVQVRSLAIILCAAAIPPAAWFASFCLTELMTGPLASPMWQVTGLAMAAGAACVVLAMYVAIAKPDAPTKHLRGDILRMGIPAAIWTPAWLAIMLAASAGRTFIIQLATFTSISVAISYLASAWLLSAAARRTTTQLQPPSNSRLACGITAALICVEIGSLHGFAATPNVNNTLTTDLLSGSQPWMLFGQASIAVVLIYFLMLLEVRIALMAALPVAAGLLGALLVGFLAGGSEEQSWLVLFGMAGTLGGHYPLWFVTEQQQYPQQEDTRRGIAKAIVLCSATCAATGFACLGFSDNPMLRNAALPGVVAIMITAATSLVWVPRLMYRIFASHEANKPHADDWKHRVRHRYRYAGPFPRIFATIKLNTDPLFEQLHKITHALPKVGRVLDIGCGTGVPACAMAQWHEDATIFGLDPACERARVANNALGKRGRACCGQAPQLEAPDLPRQFDTVVALDMSHYLDDEAFAAMLHRVHSLLAPGGTLIMRAVVPPDAPVTWMWRWFALSDALHRRDIFHRTPAELQEAMLDAGFRVDRCDLVADNHEMAWCIATKEN